MMEGDIHTEEGMPGSIRPPRILTRPPSPGFFSSSFGLASYFRGGLAVSSTPG